jgi:signal transduction histidine kinase
MDAVPAPEDRAHRLLIVDDNAIDQRHYRRLLAAENPNAFHTTASSTGAAGLAALRAQNFDCILLDFSLPDMSGLDFLTRIAGPGGKLPCAVVLITGQGSELVAAESVRRGIQDYVVKSDLPHAELGRMIGRAIERVALRTQLDRSLRAVAESNAALAREVEVRRVAEADAAAARVHAEQANQAKSAFLAQMSHELRTPMNGIIGLTSLLLEEELPPHQRDYAQEIYHSANSLLRLLNDILDLSKLEAGKVELERIAFDLEDLLDETLDMAAHKLGEKNLELCASVDGALRHRFLGDPTRIRQVLTNFLDNAVKFTGAGGITLSATPRDAADHGVAMRLTVTDTGIGIPASALPRLFQPFSQADPNTTRLYGGSGLGLAIARQMAELMGGTVGASSVVGEGSRFWVDLTLARVQEAADEAADSLPYAFMRALLVDDQASSRTVLRAYLDELGLGVSEAADGAAALAALAAPKGGCDLVVVDQSMPGMAGDRVVAAIRGKHGAAGPRTLLMAPPGKVHTAWVADEVLTKPLGRKRLHACVGRLLGPPRTPQGDLPVAVSTDPFWRHDSVQRRVLLVEDHPVNQKVAMGILRKAGYRVDLASNGLSAVSRAAQHRYDLILMDLQMPDMGGLEAAGRIRAAEQGTRVPIVALTAHAMAGAREACLAQGMDDFIGKPIDARGFLNVVRSWLRRQETGGRAQAPEASEAPEAAGAGLACPG